MSNTKQMFRLTLEFLKSNYKNWEETHSEYLTLFQVIEYGDLEPIHTMFLYWLLRPAYHKKTYKDKYVREFLSRNGIETNSNDKILVHTEEISSIPIEDMEKQRRRADIWIDIQRGKSKQTIVVENKINDVLKEDQVVQEMEQYLGNEKGDIYIALLLDSNRYQYENLEKNPLVIKTQKKKGIIFKLFTYSDWLKLNEEFFIHFIKDEERDEYDKIKHLNENIRRLMNMEEHENFNEDSRLYIQNIKVIRHFEEQFIAQNEKFLEHLRNRIKKIFKTDATFGDNKLLHIFINKFEIEIICGPDDYIDNEVWFGVELPKVLKNRDIYLKKLKKVAKYDPCGLKGWEYFIITVNPYDISNMEDTIIKKMKEIERILS